MAPQNDPEYVQRELAKKNTDQSVKKLAFDPATGELIVQSAYETQQTDAVVVDQIYKDGFFLNLL
jgi:hypothetical protein